MMHTIEISLALSLMSLVLGVFEDGFNHQPIHKNVKDYMLKTTTGTC